MPFLAEIAITVPNQDLLSWMFDNPSYDVDKPVISYSPKNEIYIDAAIPSRSISHREALLLTRQQAAGLREAGLQDGDCVCLHSFNDIYYSMAFLGIIAAGGIFAGTNPAYTTYELTHAIRTAAIRFFIVDPALLPNVLAACTETGLPHSHIIVFDPPHPSAHPAPVPISSNLPTWSSLLNHGEADWHRFDAKILSESIPVARLFSSGTTGLPKALDLTHANFVAQHTLVMEYRPRPYEVRRLICNPMFHVSQVPRAHTSPIRGGIVTVVMRRFEMQAWLANLARFEISEVNLVPQMVVMILASGQAERSSFRTIRNSWSGAAPLDPSLQKKFKKLLPEGAPLNQVWGMSETSCIATMLYYPEEDATGSVGKFIPNLDAKIVDDDGRDISGVNVRGEVCVRGPTIVRGYYKRANEGDWDEEGYFHTGDIGYVDERGMWWVVDRKKELIKVRGFQVAPAELEAVLLHHPSIVDAAVIGVQPDPTASELPRAYVVPRPGAAVTVEDVRKFSQERLARYKNLDGGVVFVQEIPKNASGKILKNLLRDRAKRELGAKI
ncbi:4-coumarate-CoA ligase-like protein, partial [Trichodelitschia bisporula]